MARTKRMPQELRRRESITAKVTLGFRDAVAAAAAAEGRTVSEWLAQAAEEALKKAKAV